LPAKPFLESEAYSVFGATGLRSDSTHEASFRPPNILQNGAVPVVGNAPALSRLRPRFRRATDGRKTSA